MDPSKKLWTADISLCKGVSFKTALIIAPLGSIDTLRRKTSSALSLWGKHFGLVNRKIFILGRQS